VPSGRTACWTAGVVSGILHLAEQTPPRHRLSRVPRLKTVLLAVVLLSACGTSSPQDASGTDSTKAGVTSTSIATAPTPYGPSTALPDEQFNLYTRCGINGAMIHGVWWQATTPLSDGNGNPPPGWGNPSQDGVLHFLDSGSVVFRTSNPNQDGALRFLDSSSVVSRMSNPNLTVKLERTTSTDYPFRCS